MNFLSHHAVALAECSAEEPAAFYVGNVLPDLVTTSGEGRIRLRWLPPESLDDPLTRGIRLHIETDRRFHVSPAFADAQASAKELLRSAAFETPPQRVFFLAHAAVEIALDGLLLQSHPGLAEDFYDRFASADLVAIVARTQDFLPSQTPPPIALAYGIERFVGSRYLFEYATAEGQAEALDRVSRRVGIASGFANAGDRRRLTDFFARLGAALRPDADKLLFRADALVVK